MKKIVMMQEQRSILAFCKKIEPYVAYYKRQIKSYSDAAHGILKNKIDLISPQLLTKQKCGIITTLVSSFIGLAYEGIFPVFCTINTQSFTQSS